MSGEPGSKQRHRRAAWWLGLGAVPCGLWVAVGMIAPGDVGPPAPQAAPAAGMVIERVDVAGLVNVADTYARSYLKTAAGEPYDPRIVEEDITRLIKTGKFDDVRAEPTMEAGKLVIVFRVVERPFVESVEFVGNAKFSTKDLLAEIELAPGSAISEFLIKQALINIERKYKEAGYYYVRIEVDRELLEQERVVRFDISEGPRVKVRKIRFEGNAAFPSSKLAGKIETKTYIWVFRTGEFDEERAERDAAALQNYYRDEGYLDARVGYKTDIAPNGTDLTLTFVIDEGPRYAVRNLTFQGNTVFTSDELLAATKLQPEAVFAAEVVKRDLKMLTDKYGEIGYIYADVQSEWVYAQEEAYVDVTIRIQEQAQFRFGRIVVRGNTQTKDKVIRRELRFFPEELYNTVAARDAENRLVETRLFNSVTITPVGDQPGVRDALVRVEEAQTTTVLFSVGVTSNSGLVGSVTIENRNFDLFDAPRNASELFKGRAFKGAGQIFRMQLEPGTEFTRARIDFREPYLLDQDFGFGTGIYLFERGRDEFDEQRIGFNVSFDHRFRSGLLKNWAAEAAFRFESVEISDTDWLTAEEIREDRGTSWLTSVKGTLVRDTTDSRFLPTRGNRLSVSYEQAGALGGDYSFGKLIGDFAQHFTLLTDSTDRKHVLSFGTTIGQIFGDAPVFERFYGGGIGSIRGFEFRGISPRAGIRDDRIGGDFQFLVNTEYSFPLIGKTVRGVTFLDMGTIEEDFGIHTWRAAVGVGARIYVKYFGPIPMAFDFAFPISSDDDDDEQVFSFSFGTSF